MSAAGSNETKTTGGKCPICGAPAQYAVRPFCSRRCADIDLGKWMSGAYTIGGEADAEEDDDQALARGAADKRRGDEPKEPDR